MTLVALAVRRGLEYYSSSSRSLSKRDSQQDELERFLSSGLGFAVIATVIVFFLTASLVDYAVSYVVATLAMVETPSSAIAVTPASADAAPKSAGDEAKEGLLETGPNITLVAQKPITAKIRGTVRHLRAEAGKFAPWRGLANRGLYHFSFLFIFSSLEAIFPKFPGVLVLISAITGALVAQIHVAWTHKVISMPNQSHYWQRFVSRSDWKALALPAAIQASSTYVTLYVIQALAFLLGFDNTAAVKEPENGGEAAWMIVKSLAVFAMVFACALFFCLPALVTLIRVEASLLPEEHESIVPFDRTFNGKVEPRIHGGTGRLGFIDAWKSFTWEARRRLVKLYCKAAIISAAIAFIFIHIIVLDVWAFGAPAFMSYMKAQEAQQN